MGLLEFEDQLRTIEPLLFRLQAKKWDCSKVSIRKAPPRSPIAESVSPALSNQMPTRPFQPFRLKSPFERHLQIADRRKCPATSIESNAYETVPDGPYSPYAFIHWQEFEDQFRRIEPPILSPPGKEMGLLERCNQQLTDKYIFSALNKYSLSETNVTKIRRELLGNKHSPSFLAIRLPHPGAGTINPMEDNDESLSNVIHQIAPFQEKEGKMAVINKVNLICIRRQTVSFSLYFASSLHSKGHSRSPTAESVLPPLSKPMLTRVSLRKAPPRSLTVESVLPPLSNQMPTRVSIRKAPPRSPTVGSVLPPVSNQMPTR
ncbi:hypothetical protein CDAR_190401 [Caerostris darwini]|uniref:Uncharacterized protein n=1 Tax=Caerostris darwini TaxID=1538125 RepID=A0AAV4MM77_9ARAC|nr:hypothetical protein CDAR_190401 [Caerostris darwini]